MKFVVDENLPVRLAEWLVGEGFEADHVIPLGLGATKDPSSLLGLPNATS